MSKKKKESNVFISEFAFEELKKMFQKQKSEIHYLRNCLKYYNEQATQIF
jgi:hypothetical protein